MLTMRSHLHLRVRLRLVPLMALAWLLATAQLAGVTRAAAPEAKQKAFCWKVTSPTATVYLLGSMHMATKEIYPLPPEIETAFAQSSTLAVELDPDKVDQMGLLKIMQDKGMYPGNQTLSGSIAKPLADALKAWADANGMPMMLFDKFKPWAAGATIGALAMQQAGLDPELGIDKHFLNEARDKKKKIVELESADSQITALASFPPKLQETWLKATLDQNKDLPDTIKKLNDAWVAGDEKAMMSLEAGDDKALAPINAKLVDERNVSMAKTIQPYLAGHDTIFVVVGSAHLIGPKGIPALLTADKQATVEQMTVTRSATTKP